MRSGVSQTMASEGASRGINGFMHRQILRMCGLAMFGICIFAVIAIATWNVVDPSFSLANSNEVTNAMGYPGAVFADLVMQFLGIGALAALMPGVIWACLMFSGVALNRRGHRALGWVGFSILTAAFLSLFPVPITWPLPNGLGGVLGDMAVRIPGLFVGGYPGGLFALFLGVVLILPIFGLFLFASGLFGQGELDEFDDDDHASNEVYDDDNVGFSSLALGYLTHWWLSARFYLQRLNAERLRNKELSGAQNYSDPQYNPYQGEIDGAGYEHDVHGTHADTMALNSDENLQTRVEPDFDAQGRPVNVGDPVFQQPAGLNPTHHHVADNDYAPQIAPANTSRVIPPVKPSHPVINPVPHPQSDEEYDQAPVELNRRAPMATPMSPPQMAHGTQNRVAPAPQAPTRNAGNTARGQNNGWPANSGFIMPDLDFLSEPPSTKRHPSLSEQALEHKARLLEGVLADFKVKGEIIHVRPGPVVTLYELEPEPGIKSSRVIGLADDIARSMSAIAARVAVVPGRNAIGIELPNIHRETVYLRELFDSLDYDNSKAKLPLTLGKTINGDAVIADLAKMPHLLVAGTTGSGKSVAINTMILSLVYKMTPEQCRLIMIDPKMLELSIYDGIPHLLTPVVTDPKKAVVALKWTVREMEDRYRKMSKVGVRNIDGFNQRVREALTKGEMITRTVQTGYDRETGEAVYESEELNLDPMPYIVVIIDEMADLMMVAGKEIEGTVQRLAQMARAAGIHVIMATQRPSVDVITGTIKANFPTRISFQVTSKIDSRTILGEQGAEQLLGMGDMLYMAGGGRIQRVHGPFVADDEVEKIVQHLKTQGVPEYLDSITEDDEEEEGSGGDSSSAAAGNGSASDDPYDQAVAIVLRDGKASTSYVQRRLGIGYNRAASIIERMEDEGVISAANHAGKREILVPRPEDEPF